MEEISIASDIGALKDNTILLSIVLNRFIGKAYPHMTYKPIYWYDMVS